jgi:steroid delta-isomerase-like uncharacterized protein
MGQAQEVAEAFYECFRNGDFEGARALYADDCMTVTPGGTLDNEGHEMMGRGFKAAFPDAHMEVERALDSGDEVYISGRFVGTHEGDLVSPGGTIPASGQALNLPFIDYFRVSDGKIVAQEGVFDQMTMLGQLGALPG